MIDKKILQGTLKLYRNIKSGELKPEHETNPNPNTIQNSFLMRSHDDVGL